MLTFQKTDKTAVGVAAHIGGDLMKVNHLLDKFCDLGVLEKIGDAYATKEVNLTTSHRHSRAVLL
ncbi:MAG: hypothetical protein EOP04_21245 [Proteobacteria bacterium]|nr:MAG: hypothetical protein EOP04_21245 [Pseudomonadota bacterium]